MNTNIHITQNNKNDNTKQKQKVKNNGYKTRPTPTLEGKDAERFLKKMHKPTSNED